MGSNTDNARTRLAIEYSKQLPKEQLLSFVKKTYHGGYGLKFGDTKVCAWYARDGMHITYGDSARYARNAQIISWEEMYNRIGELLEEGQFATNVELAEMRSFEQKELAEKLIYMTRDIDHKRTDNRYMSIIHNLRGGFPDEVEQIKGFLSDPKYYGVIMEQLYDLQDAYNRENQVMRFRSSNPTKIVPLMEQYAIPRKEYTSEMAEIPEEHPFITEDEITEAIAGGSVTSGSSKSRIHEFYKTPHTPKEKLDFIKNEYGTSGGNNALSRNFRSHEWADGKGICYDKPGCTRVELNWRKVVKYMDAAMDIVQRSQREEAQRTPEPEKAQPADMTKTAASLYNDAKHDHPDDIVLFQMGDFFEIYGDDAKLAAPILDLHLASRPVPAAGRTEMCGIPAHKLEENLEKLRLHHPVTISAAKEDGSRNVYSLGKLEPPAPVVEETVHENVAQTIASVGPFWEAYREVKKEHPDYYALVKLNDGYFAFEKDAQAISKLLGLETVKREVIGRKRPVTVCFLPVADFQEHSAAISKTGAGMVLVDRVPGKELENFVILSEKDAEKAKEAQKEITQADIDKFLLDDWGVPGRRERIAAHIRSGKDNSELAAILRQEYNQHDIREGSTAGGGNITLADDSPGYAYYIYAGVRITPRPEGIQREISYEEMVGHIKSLIQDGRYPYPAPNEITQVDIDDALILGCRSLDSKHTIISYMQEHGRERNTAAWLAKEYGYDSDSPMMISRAGNPDVTVTLTWPKVQRRIAQLIKEDRFLTDAEKQPSLTVREIYDQFYPVIRDAVLNDVAYQNACKHSDIENAHMEGNEAVRRAALDNGDMQLMKLYFDSTKFHNRLHREIVDETYPVLSNSQPPRYQVETYHHIENGFDDKKDYRSLEDAEKAAQGYWDGTKEEDGFQYEGAAVYDNQDKKYIRVWGDFPDSRAARDVAVLSADPQPIPRYDPKRFSIRPFPNVADDLAIWDATQNDFYSEGGRTIHFDNLVSAENYLHGLQHIAGVNEGQTLENVVFTTPKGNTFKFGDAFHSDRNEAWREDSVIDYINDSYVWYTIPNEPERPPVKLRRSLFELNLDSGIFSISTQKQPLLQEEPSTETLHPNRVVEGYPMGENIVFGGQDAQIASQVLGIPLEQEPVESVPVCRIPQSAFSVQAFEQQGYRVSVFEYDKDSGFVDIIPEDTPSLTLPYRVGQQVYLDDTEFTITEIRENEVQLQDPFLAYPIFRAESKSRFEFLLQQDDRNGAFTEFLAADLNDTDTDLQDVLTADGGLLSQNDKEDIAQMFRNGESNTRIAQQLVNMYSRYGSSMVFPTGEEVTFAAGVHGVSYLIHDRHGETTSYRWNEIAPVLRAMFNEERDGFYHVQPSTQSFVKLDELAKDEPIETIEEELDRNPISIQVDGEWKTFPNAKAAEEAAYEEHKANVRRNAQNFHITDDDLGVGGAKAKFQANINAIKLLKSLEAEGAQATPEQQEVLSRYVGWGGVPDAFDPNKANWAAEYQELKDLLTPAEYPNTIRVGAIGQ